jgi:hypothetical protein
MNPLQQEVDFQTQALENGTAALANLNREARELLDSRASTEALVDVNQRISNQIRVNSITQENLNDAVAKLNGQTTVPAKSYEKVDAASQTADEPFTNDITDEELGPEELSNLEDVDSGWTDQDGFMILDDDGWDEQDGLMIHSSDQTDDEDSEELFELSSGYVPVTSTSGTPNTTSTQFTPTPVMNPLHSYATYTYGINLFILTKEESKTVTENPDRLVPKHCLISSGGKHNSTTLRRHPEFKDDFYFSDLKLTTIIGMNSRSKASNAVEISFSIIEPYGLTLLDRIIEASKGVASRNYLEMPYLLEIEFYGSDDMGKQFKPIPGITKRIPIKLIEMKVKVGTKGGEYQLRAIPFNHQAFQENTASTPINLEIDADTVQAFFSDKEEKISGATTNPAVQQQAQLAKKIKTNSYTGGVNSWYKYLKSTDARKNTDTIKFEIDPEIAKSSIVNPNRNEPGRTPVPDPGSKEALAAKKNDSAGPNFKTSSFSINAGTSVMRVIDMVMRSSEYITSQVSDPLSSDPQATADKLGKPLNWYKVIPQIVLNEFDENTNRWSKTITYYIKKYTVYNSKHVYGPQSKPSGAVKKYDYMYTGKNNDIIDFQIDFDTLFYTAIQSNRSSHETLSGAAAPVEDKSKENTIKNPSGGKNSPFPVQITPIADDPGNNAGIDGIRNSVTKTAADMQKSIYSGSRGDMLNLKMKILGDPHFIKQDDIYNNPSNSNYASITSGQLIPGNNSLVMDVSEIHCLVSFKTPVDIDETTGLVRKDGKYLESSFSGMYRVLMVSTEFRGGKFEQTLDMIRIFDDVPTNSASLTNQRAGAANNNLGARSLPGNLSNTTWSDQNGLLVSDDDGWEDQDGLMISTSDREEEFLLNDVDEEFIEEDNGEFVEDADFEELSEIVDSDEEEVDVTEWEEEQQTSKEETPVKTPDQAEVKSVQSQPSNTPRGRAIAEQQRVLDALQNEINVYTEANAELQSNVNKANDALDAAEASGNAAAIKEARSNLKIAIDEKKNMSIKLKEAQAQVGEEEQKLKAI